MHHPANHRRIEQLLLGHPTHIPGQPGEKKRIGHRRMIGDDNVRSMRDVWRRSALDVEFPEWSKAPRHSTKPAEPATRKPLGWIVCMPEMRQPHDGQKSERASCELRIGVEACHRV